MKKFATYVFDMDGVLLDSNEVKSQAFYDTAMAYGQRAAEEMLRFHQSAGSISRSARWQRFLRHVGRPSALDGLMDECSRRIDQGVRSCAVVRGVEEYLRSIDGRKVVVTGAEAGEATELLSHHKLIGHFDGVWGGPPRKSKLLASLVGREIELPAVYFGDTRDDYESATNAGMEFVFVSGHTEWGEWKTFFAERKVQTICDFREML